MLDALKDLYIAHPFMPVADKPEWYSHIKDIRCVVELPASNIISQYKNGNFIRAWLQSVTATTATIRIICAQLNYADTKVVPLYIWTGGAPSSDSYIIVDESFVYSEVTAGNYELQPDTLIFMQAAPKLYMGTAVQGEQIDIQPGYNVSVSGTTKGIMFFGAAGAGLGTYTGDPIAALGPDQKGYGARNLNGMVNSVWIKGSYPVSADAKPEDSALKLKVELK